VGSCGVVGVNGGGSFRAGSWGAVTEDPRLVGSAGAVFVRSGSGGTKRAAAAVTSGFAVVALLGGSAGLNGSAS
jgi:hypothetical protein